MRELVPSYLDGKIKSAVRGKKLDPTILGFEKGKLGKPRLLKVTTVPHAINSVLYDERPACDGHTSCVPLCPIKARYEAIVHVDKALKHGAVLRTQAVVTRLELDG